MSYVSLNYHKTPFEKIWHHATLDLRKSVMAEVWPPKLRSFLPFVVPPCCTPHNDGEIARWFWDHERHLHGVPPWSWRFCLLVLAINSAVRCTQNHLVERDSNSLILQLGDGFKVFLSSPLYLQRWSNLTNIFFQRGWFKQQLDNMCYIIDQWIISVHIIPTMKTPPYVSSNLILQRIEVWWFTKVILKPWVSLPWISYPWNLASGTSLRFSDVGWKWWFLVSFPIISLVGYTRGDRNFTSWKITFFVKISWIYVWCMEIWWPQKKINLRFRGVSRPPYVFYFTVGYSVKGMGWKGKYLNQPSDKAVWGMLALPSSLHDDIWRPRRLSDTLRCFMAILEPCCKVGF